MSAPEVYDIEFQQTSNGNALLQTQSTPTLSNTMDPKINSYSHSQYNNNNNNNNTTYIKPFQYSQLINNQISETNPCFEYLNLVVSDSDCSTILHIAASIGNTNIKYIIDKIPALLNRQNNRGDLPIHVAARSCQFQAAKDLLQHLYVVNRPGYLTFLLNQQNYDGNTALHLALLNQHKEMSQFFFENCPNTFYLYNNHKFSPLYLAIKAEFWDLVQSILRIRNFDERIEAEKRLQAEDPVSVVHAVILAKNKDIFELMYENFKDMVLYKKDEMGRTPLSYAAYTGFLDGVKCILNDLASKEQAYRIENGSFPIHWACRGGDIKVVKVFFSELPIEAMKMLNSKGQNILHVAAASGKVEVVKHILQHPALEIMINMKDEDGYTPLHLASRGKHPKVVYEFTWDKRINLSAQSKDGCTALDIAEDFGNQTPSFEERLIWLSLRNAGVPRSSQLHRMDEDIISQHGMRFAGDFNNQSTDVLYDDQQETPIISSQFNMKRQTNNKERINTIVLVAALVATVTFASGFAIPGGYKIKDPNEGSATFAQKGAFQVFVISNTIAMYTSILAMVTLIWAQLDELRLVLLSLDFALPLLGISMAMMSVAFMAGLYVMLHGVVFWLALVVLLIGGMSLGILFVLFIPLYLPRSCIIKNRVMRNVIHLSFKLMFLACEEDKSAKHY